MSIWLPKLHPYLGPLEPVARLDVNLDSPRAVVHLDELARNPPVEGRRQVLRLVTNVPHRNRVQRGKLVVPFLVTSHREFELVETNLAVAVGVHLLHHFFGRPVAQHRSNSRALHKLLDVGPAQVSQPIEVHLVEEAFEGPTLFRLPCGNQPPHELIVIHLLPSVAQKALDQSVDLRGFPARAEHSAHLISGNAPVLVAVQFDEQLVEIPQLCQVFPRSDVRQKSAVQPRLFLAFHQFSKDLLINPLTNV
mmetsp:Transcript_27171/g.71507  ORF Transcript_27171/g.71507 Transcript_27171/m.71507 type:complete len:250 (+) Transcript_27171:132-881(+)